MAITKEMKEMMQRSLEEYFTAYWKEHATPEQEAKRVADGKTFKGAAVFVESVAKKHRGGKPCVAMPDELAYWLLMEYMENGEEGSEYKTPEEIENEARRREGADKPDKPAAALPVKERVSRAKKIAAKVEEAQLKLF